MYKSNGSSSSLPIVPRGAVVSTCPVSDSKPPETSTNPPLPPSGPPLADSDPAMEVMPVDSSTILPPSPRFVASAAMTAPGAMVTLAETRVGVTAGPPLALASVVPIATTPPPWLPEALIRAVAAIATLPVGATSMLPAAAESWPSTTIDPPMPFSTTVPLLASMVPPDWTSRPTTPSAARAVNCTVPPSARMIPVLVTSAVAPDGACVTWFVTSSEISPSPNRSSVAVRAPASTTCPIFAEIVPEFATLGATKAARPALAIVIVPSLTTRAFGAAG